MDIRRLHHKNPMGDKSLKSAIAVLPGLCIVLWYLEFAKFVSIEIFSIVLIFLCLSVVFAFASQDQPIREKGYPSMGALLWLMGIWLPQAWLHLGKGVWYWIVEEFYNGFYSLFEMPATWSFYGIVVLFVLLIGAWTYRGVRLRLTGYERRGLGLLGLLTAFNVVSYACLSKFTLLLLPLLALNFLCLFLITILGLRLARYNSLSARLWVTVCEPAWVVVILRSLPAETYLFWSLDVQPSIEFLALLILPILSFLIIIPIGLLSISSQRSQGRWILLASALTLFVLRIIGFSIERHYSIQFPFDWWLIKNLTALQIWMPIWIIAGPLRVQEDTSRGRERG
jgi:hypothetical protein